MLGLPQVPAVDHSYTATSRRPRGATWSIFATALIQQEEGHPVKDEDVRRLSSLHHENINMLGRYSFLMPDAVVRGELRSLRNPEDTNL